MSDKKIVIRMKKSQPCSKNSIVYKSTDSVGEDAVRSLYLTNSGYSKLEAPNEIVVTIQKG